ncbi:MAG: hypothetical protein AABW56_01005 [Nanoarchaeota archaeon]
MDKRGQITVFVILGILILAVLGIIFYLYGERLQVDLPGTSDFDFSQSEVLKNYIETCIQNSGSKALDLVGAQGGEINPGFYLLYYGNKVSYSCYTTEYGACYNKKPFLSSSIKAEIDEYVRRGITSCALQLDNVARSNGYIVEKGNLNVDTVINPYNAIINVNYPITIKNDESQIQQSNFIKTFNTPLGRLIKSAEDIVNQEIKNSQGVVFYNSYSLSQNGEISVQRDTYENTEIYIINAPNNPYKFQFAVQNYVNPFP